MAVVSPQRWRRTEELFFAAEELNAAERGQFLAQACGDDTELRREVEALLGSAGQTLPLMQQSLQAIATDIVRGDDLAAGARIGNYEIIREIGSGGMGVVYLARRADDEFRQLTAIKLLRNGVNHRELLLRFRAERQILANLVHPNIARLLDGGVTPQGQPFLVMEYVDGLPLLDYCRQHNLNVRQRLEMFRQICSGVECAHRNLVVHRDIKPANVLVDREGTPKLLDFGIAKLLAPDQIDQTIALTTYTERLMTPEYASPEQVRGQAITTSTDVYSLGVVLYELLTGARPLKFKTKTPIEIERVICETEPARPGSVATLDPDLDTIVLRAMDKVANRRYATPTELSEDIRRHLSGFPIQARPDTFFYRAGKFARRNRWPVALSATAAVLIIAFGIGMGVLGRRAQLEGQRAQAEARRAEAVSQFLLTMFESTDPEKTGKLAMTARDVLDRGTQRLATLKSEPEVRAKLLRNIGLAYESIGEWRQAHGLLEEALAIEKRRGARTADVAHGYKNLAELERRLGDPLAAERSAREAMSIWRALLGQEHEHYLEGQNTLGLALQEQGRPREAAVLFENVLARRAKLSSRTNFDTAILSNAGGVYVELGDYAKAEGYLRECIAIREKQLGPDHPRIPRVLVRLARLLEFQGRLDEAQAAAERTIAVQRKHFGERHPELALAYLRLASINRTGGNWAQASDYLSRAQQVQAATGLDKGETEYEQARLSEARRELALAESTYQIALEKQVNRLGADAPQTRQTRIALGRVALDRGDLHRAQRILEPILARERAKPLAEPKLAEFDLLEAQLRHALGDRTAAQTLYRRNLGFLRKTLPPRHPALADALLGLGTIACQSNRTGEGEQLLREAASLVRSHAALRWKARLAVCRL